MKQRKVFFQSGALNLEGRLVIPRRAATGAGVVICLPHPRYGVKKIYEVTVEGRAELDQIEAFKHGIRDMGELLKAQRAHILTASKGRSVIELELAEGKNREVRRMCAAVGLTVERLVRTQVGKIKLGELRLGRWRTLTDSEIKTLLSQNL